MNRDVVIHTVQFPTPAATFNWGVIRGLSERADSVAVVTSLPGDWDAIGGRSAFKGRVLCPRIRRFPLLKGKWAYGANLLCEVVRLAIQDPDSAQRVQQAYPLGRITAASNIWEQAFLKDQLPQHSFLSHGLEGGSARRATMLRKVGFVKGPVVGTFNGGDITSAVRRAGSDYYNEFYQEVDRIVAVSHFIRRCLIDDGAPPEKIDVLYYGVDLQKFSYRAPKGKVDHPVFVTVGRLAECKGNTYAIDAFAQILERWPDAMLKIIGDGALTASLKAQAEAKLPRTSYRFTGMISHELVAAELATSDVLLAPGIVDQNGVEEALGGSVIEAHAIGLPVICSSVGGLPEAVIDGESAFVVPQKNIRALAQAMITMLEQSDRWPEMSRAGRHHIEEYFSSDGYIDRLDRVYQRAWEHYECGNNNG